MSLDGQMLNKKLQHSELCNTVEWGGLVKSSVALESLRQANGPNLATSIKARNRFTSQENGTHVEI